MATVQVPTATTPRLWRAASVLAGGPAALIFIATTLFFLAGLPITLLLVPFAIPVLLLSAVQAKAAYRCWQGSPEAARRLRNVSLAVAMVVGALLLAGVALTGDDTTIRDPDSVRQTAVLKAVAVFLVVADTTALPLLRDLPQRRRPSPATVATAAATVLVAGLLALSFWPTKG